MAASLRPRPPSASGDLSPEAQAAGCWTCPACDTFNWRLDYCWQCREPRQPQVEPPPPEAA